MKRLSLVALALLICAPASVRAQLPFLHGRLSEHRTLFGGSPVLAIRAEASGASRDASLRRAVSISGEIDSTTNRRVWPYFALGGAIAGGVGVLVYAVAKCDAECKDDGALSFLPPYVAAGAVGGALIGAIVGLAIDRGPRLPHPRR